MEPSLKTWRWSRSISGIRGMTGMTPSSRTRGVRRSCLGRTSRNVCTSPEIFRGSIRRTHVKERTVIGSDFALSTRSSLFVFTIQEASTSSRTIELSEIIEVDRADKETCVALLKVVQTGERGLCRCGRFMGGMAMRNCADSLGQNSRRAREPIGLQGSPGSLG